MRPLTPSAKRRRTFLFSLTLLAFLVAVALLAFKANSLRKSHFTFAPLQSGWVMPGLVKQVAAIPPFPTRCIFSFPFTVTAGTPQPLVFSFESLADERALAVDSAPMALPSAQPVTLPTLPPGQHTLTLDLTRNKGLPALTATLSDAYGSALITTSASDLPDSAKSQAAPVTYTINGSFAAFPRPVTDPWIGDAADPLDLQPSIIWGQPLLTASLAILALVIAAGGLYLARHPRASQSPLSARQYWAIVAVTAVIWSLLLLLAWSNLHVNRGYDLSGHLLYIKHILAHGTVPLATQGWQMYQAPLYYYLAAGLLYITGTPFESPHAFFFLRGLNLLLALLFLLATALAMRNFAGRRLNRAALAFLLVACCPVSFYIFCYITNENLATLTTACVFLALSRLHTRQSTSLRHAALLGLALGLALLAKVSTLLLIVPITGFYALKLLARKKGDRHLLPPASPSASPKSKSLVPFLLFLATALLVCSPYYIYVWINLGSPIVGNWDAASGQAWWQMPSVRSLGDYIPSLHPFYAPLYAGFHDVWSGLWSTLAGDALLASSTRIDVRPGFNYWVFPLTLCTTLLFLVLAVLGFFARNSLIRARARRMDLVLLLAGLGAGFALVYMTLIVPSYAQAKSFYAMSVILPAAFFAASVLVRPASRSAPLNSSCLPLRTVLCLIAPWAIAFMAMFLAVPTAQSRCANAIALVCASPPDEPAAIAALTDTLQRDPTLWPARIALARLLVTQPGQGDRVAELIDIPALDALTPSDTAPCVSARLFIKAQLLASLGRTDEALSTMSRAIIAGPAQADSWATQVLWLRQTGHADQARDLARAGLVYHPWNPDLLAASR
jgi:hypothetical protein